MQDAFFCGHFANIFVVYANIFVICAIIILIVRYIDAIFYVAIMANELVLYGRQSWARLAVFYFISSSICFLSL